MDFQKNIREEQLKDKINILKNTTILSKKEIKKPEEDGGDIIDKSLNFIGDLLGQDAVNNIEKSINHKYFKREGSPGNYKYYYTEEQYKKEKGEDKEEANNKESSIQYTYNEIISGINKWMDASLKNEGDTDVPEGKEVDKILDKLSNYGTSETTLGEMIGEHLSYLVPGDKEGLKITSKYIKAKLNKYLKLK